MEIEETKGKLEVFKPLGDQEDAAVQKMIEDMKNEWGKKIEELEYLESLISTLTKKSDRAMISYKLLVKN